MTVAQLSAQMTMVEYLQWMALYEVEGREHERLMKRAREGR